MDLNEVPIDIVVDGLKIEEKKKVNYNGVVDKELECVRIKSNEQRCREIEENRLVLELEIRNKEMNLKAIEAKIRVLGDEKKTVEEEIRDLKKKKKKKVALEGTEASDTSGGKFSLAECQIESDELSRVDQLMVENKVLECEKNMAIKEVDFWKQKCKDLESRVLELEEKLEGKGTHSISIGIKAEEATAMNCDDDCALRDFASPSCMHGAVDGVLPMEDNRFVATEYTPINKVQAKRRLAYPNERNCDEKIAPPTPAGGKSSGTSVIDIIDSDNECDVHARHKPNSQSEGYTFMMSENGVHKTDKIMDVHCEEDQSSGRGDPPSILTPMSKRKRDLMVVTSDDECENNGCTPNRRSLKIENSDNEGEEDVDNIKTIRRVSKRITSESESDDEDNIPISQLKSSHAYKCSSQTASTLNPTRPRRRLVKYGQAERTEKAQEMENDPDTLTAENAANDDLSEEESESSVQSLSRFIVDDSDDENVEDDMFKEDVQQEHSSELEEGSYDNLDFEEIISRLQSRRHANSKWTSEGDMLSDFGKNPELCLRAVCALYRQQTNEEKAFKASLVNNGRGFSKFDATRGTLLGDFLTDGDSNGDLVKSVEELKVYHRHGLEECRTLADRYSKQLFKIYENKEDPFFP